MKAQVGFKIAVVVVILALTAMPGLAQGLPEMAGAASASGGSVWRTAYVDQSGDRGTHTAIAFDPTSGTSWISYYDKGNGDLMVAHRVSSGGNCGPNNEWYCETVDSTSDVGQNSSIDVYIDPAILHSRRVGVAYQDATAKSLKFAEYSCTPSYPPICFWSAVTIDQGDAGGLAGYGRYTSVKYDANGRPHIAYYVVRWEGDLIFSELRFAYRVDSGGNCGVGGAAGKWQCYTVDSPGVGEYASMEMTYAGSLLVPYIAYYDGANGDLMLARYIGGSGGTGCTHPSWSCQTIDGASADVGQSVSFELTNGQYFAYYDATHGKLKYAYHVWAGEGNCGGGNFQCVNIEDAAAPSSDARSISLAVDSADNPLIAYRYSSGGVSQLRVAQPIDALGLSNGNCGPLGAGFTPTWQCLTVDTGSTAPLVSVAEHVSTAFDPDESPLIAYSRWGYTISGGDDDLKIAYPGSVVFLPLVLRNSP